MVVQVLLVVKERSTVSTDYVYRSADDGAGPTGSKGTVHCLY